MNDIRQRRMIAALRHDISSCGRYEGVPSGRIESAFRKGVRPFAAVPFRKVFLMSEAYLHMPAGHISQPRRGYIIPHTATPYIILYLAPGRQIVYNMDNKGRGSGRCFSLSPAGPAPGNPPGSGKRCGVSGRRGRRSITSCRNSIRLRWSGGITPMIF